MEFPYRHRAIRRLWSRLDTIQLLGMAHGREIPHPFLSGEKTNRVGEHSAKCVLVCKQLRRSQLRSHLLPSCQGRRSLPQRYLYAALHPDATTMPRHLWRLG